MNEELNSKQYYNLVLNDNNEYVFTTDHEIEYKITFTPGGDFYYFAFDKSATEEEKEQKEDYKIRNTICYALERFLSKNNNAIIVICEQSDNRQVGRHILFKRWYANAENKDIYIKKDFEMEFEGNGLYEESIPFRASCIIHKDNPRKDYLLKEIESYML